jgi:hypothetical protein
MSPPRQFEFDSDGLLYLHDFEVTMEEARRLTGVGMNFETLTASRTKSKSVYNSVDLLLEYLIHPASRS